MKFRLLADENIEHRVVHRLRNFGHDVEHVDFVPSLGKGVDGERIARYSLDENRLVHSSDSDFLTTFQEDDYTCLFVHPG